MDKYEIGDRVMYTSGSFVGALGTLVEKADGNLWLVRWDPGSALAVAVQGINTGPSGISNGLFGGPTTYRHGEAVLRVVEKAFKEYEYKPSQEGDKDDDL